MLIITVAKAASVDITPRVVFVFGPTVEDFILELFGSTYITSF
jgi:hypothetical protein